MKTLVAVSSLQWLWCRYQARKEKELFDAVFAAQAQSKALKLKVTDPDPPPPPPPTSSAV